MPFFLEAPERPEWVVVLETPERAAGKVVASGAANCSADGAAMTLGAVRIRRKETDIPSMERMRTAVTFWDAENVVEAFICVLDTEA